MIKFLVLPTEGGRAAEPRVMSILAMIFVATRPNRCKHHWRSLLRKFKVQTQRSCWFKVQRSRVAHRRRLCRSSRFKVQSSKPSGLSWFAHRRQQSRSSRFKRSGAAGSKFKCAEARSRLPTEGSGAAVPGSKFRAPTNSPEGGELSYLSSRQANYALCIMNYALLLYVVYVI